MKLDQGVGAGAGVDTGVGAVGGETSGTKTADDATAGGISGGVGGEVGVVGSSTAKAKVKRRRPQRRRVPYNVRLCVCMWSEAVVCKSHTRTHTCAHAHTLTTFPVRTWTRSQKTLFQTFGRHRL